MGALVKMSNDKSYRVTITLKGKLLKQLLEEVPLNRKKSLSGLIASRLTLPSSGQLIKANHILIVGTLKEKATFADILKQLQALNDSLQIVSIAGDLNFTAAQAGTIEMAIQK